MVYSRSTELLLFHRLYNLISNSSPIYVSSNGNLRISIRANFRNSLTDILGATNKLGNRIRNMYTLQGNAVYFGTNNKIDLFGKILVLKMIVGYKNPYRTHNFS